jgi:hypothetical protein
MIILSGLPGEVIRRNWVQSEICGETEFGGDEAVFNGFRTGLSLSTLVVLGCSTHAHQMSSR